MIALREEWSDDCQALLESLGMLGAAIVPVAGLPERLGIPAPELEPILAEARDAELVADWDDAPVGPALMLTSRAADHLGLELVAPSRFTMTSKTGCESVYWTPRGDVPPEHATPPSKVHGELVAADVWGDEDLAGGIDDMADSRALTAEALAIRTEEALRQGLAQRDAELSRWKPLLILGQRQAWPIADDPEGWCGACRGRRLERTTFCLWCGKSGVDGILPPVPKRIARHAYRPGRLPGGKGGEPAPKKAKVPTAKRKVSKKARKARRTQPKAQTLVELMTPVPAPKAGWKVELDAMRAAAKKG